MAVGLLYEIILLYTTYTYILWKVIKLAINGVLSLLRVCVIAMLLYINGKKYLCCRR